MGKLLRAGHLKSIAEGSESVTKTVLMAEKAVL